jgi:inorganic pyrophosphatase
MNKDKEFWEKLDELVLNSEIEIERKKNSQHPRYPEYIYPFDYGYLKDTKSADGVEIDIWQIDGSRKVTGVIVTLDLVKRDSEIKVLLGARNDEQFDRILNCHQRGNMKAILVKRPQ